MGINQYRVCTENNMYIYICTYITNTYHFHHLTASESAELPLPIPDKPAKVSGFAPWWITFINDIIHKGDRDVSENDGTPKSSVLMGFSIINHPFGVPLFLETPIEWGSVFPPWVFCETGVGRVKRWHTWIYLSAFIIHLDSSLRSRKEYLWKALDKSVPRNSYTDYMYIFLYISYNQSSKIGWKTYISSLSLSCVHLHPVFTKEPMAVANHRISAFPLGEMDIAAGATRREWTLYLGLINPFPWFSPIFGDVHLRVGNLSS